MPRECLDMDPEHVAAVTGEDFVEHYPTRLRSRVALSVCARLAARRLARKLAALRNALSPIVCWFARVVLRRKPPITPERAVVRQMIRDQNHRHAEQWHFERPSRIKRYTR